MYSPVFFSLFKSFDTRVDAYARFVSQKEKKEEERKMADISVTRCDDQLLLVPRARARFQSFNWEKLFFVLLLFSYVDLGLVSLQSRRQLASKYDLRNVCVCVMCSVRVYVCCVLCICMYIHIHTYIYIYFCVCVYILWKKKNNVVQAVNDALSIATYL